MSTALTCIMKKTDAASLVRRGQSFINRNESAAECNVGRTRRRFKSLKDGSVQNERIM